MLAVYDRRIARRRFGNILARALRVPVYSPDSLIPAGTELVNWGCSATARGMPDVDWIGNTPEAVANLSHKRRMFQMFADNDVPCLDWTTDRNEAIRWCGEGHYVYARQVLQGHSGEGIQRIAPTDAIAMPEAPLYTKGVAGKFREYRVHVFGNEVIAVQLKRRMSAEKMAEMGIEPPDDEIRSAIRTYANGWVFCVNNVELPEDARRVAIQAIQACGGYSGATDLLIQNGRTIVIETNSAPALRSETVRQAYVDAIRREYNNNEQ